MNALQKMGRVGKRYKLNTTTMKLNTQQLIKVRNWKKVRFTGRQIGAIGAVHKITTDIYIGKYANMDEVREELSKKYEHISKLKIEY